MRVALYGGSFDPPHLGHEMVVKRAFETLDFDKFIIMPTFINPFKKGFFAPPNLRLKWLEELFGDLKGVKISNFEISKNRPVATIESVLEIKKTLNPDEIYLIIGADNLESLENWQNFTTLKNLVKFIVATRDDIKIPKNLQKLEINANISSSNFRENLNLNLIPAKIRSSVGEFYKRTKMEKSMKSKLEVIVKVLEDKKAENVEVIDMSDREYIAKFVVIATTLIGRHALSLADDLDASLKPLGEEFLHVESSDEWTVLDLGDIIIHLMSDEYRKKYDIEDFLSKLKF